MESLTKLQKRIARQREANAQLELRVNYYRLLLAGIVAKDPSVFTTFKPQDDVRMIDEILYIEALVASEENAAKMRFELNRLISKYGYAEDGTQLDYTEWMDARDAAALPLGLATGE